MAKRERKHFIAPKVPNSPPTVSSYSQYAEQLAALEHECRRRLEKADAHNVELRPQRLIVSATLDAASRQLAALASPALGLVAKYREQYDQLKRLNREVVPSAQRARDDLDIGDLIRSLDLLFRTEFELTGLMRRFVAAVDDIVQAIDRSEAGRENEKLSRRSIQQKRDDCLAEIKGRRDSSPFVPSDRELYSEMAKKYGRKSTKTIENWVRWGRAKGKLAELLSKLVQIAT